MQGLSLVHKAPRQRPLALRGGSGALRSVALNLGLMRQQHRLRCSHSSTLAPVCLVLLLPLAQSQIWPGPCPSPWCSLWATLQGGFLRWMSSREGGLSLATITVSTVSAGRGHLMFTRREGHALDQAQGVQGQHRCQLVGIAMVACMRHTHPCVLARCAPAQSLGTQSALTCKCTSPPLTPWLERSWQTDVQLVELVPAL
jgi:hypothetical protein